jgi:hypothetical protein
MIRAEV